MLDDTNLTGEDFFDEADFAETPETSETTEAAVETQVEENQPETISAKYNGKEIPLDKKAVEQLAEALGVKSEDYIATVQKGMNYDHVLQERDSLKNAKEFQVIDYYAKQSGMSRQEYVDYLEQCRQQQEVQAQQEEISRQYQDVPPEILKELATLKTREAERQRSEQLIQQQQKPWSDLYNAFPTLSPDKIPDAVYARVGAGLTPTAAYLAYQNEQMAAELAAYKQNEKNKQTSTGPAGGDAGTTPVDPFLEGLFG